MLDLAQPQPLTAIVAGVDAKTPIGSVLRTAGWEAMPEALSDQAFFSAGVTSVQFLAAQKKAVSDLIARAKGTNEKGETYWKMDRAKFIAEMRQLGESLNIQRPGGRPDGKVREGDVTDPVSIARLRLIINTQLELAYGHADWLTGMDPDLLEAFPAWELVRISPRRVPRDWDRLWLEAAISVQWEGVLRDVTQGKIALKTSPIWIALSRFKKPHPPFDYNSGMGVEEKDRSEAEELGLLGPDTVLIPALKPYQAGLEASAKNLGQDERKLIQEVFGSQVETTEEKVRWTGKPRQAGLKMSPAPRPIQELLKVDDALGPEMKQACDTIVQALNEVLVPIASKPLEVRPSSDLMHSFMTRSDGTPRVMEFAASDGTPHLEVAHEIGHWFASANFTTGQPLSGAPVDFTLRPTEAWLREVMETEPVKAFTEMLKTTTDQSTRNFIAWLLRPGELWARCFSEWAAVRTGQRDAMRELSQVLNGQIEGQAPDFFWGNADLKRLLPLLDELLLK